MKKLIAFIKWIFRHLFSNEYVDEPYDAEVVSEYEEENKEPEEPLEENEEEANTKKEIITSRRTVLTRLYVLEQKTIVYKELFPENYMEDLEKIKDLRNLYNKLLCENKKSLTFQINPELDVSLLQDTIQLERKVDLFIEKNVKFKLLSEKLKTLIAKLEILYNVAIEHPNEANKIYSRSDIAREFAKSLYNEISENKAILEDEQMLERFVKLLVYAEYLITKTRVRISYEKPTQKSKIMENFDYTKAFTAFASDELQQADEMISKIQEEEIRKTIKSDKEKLVQELILKNGFLDEPEGFEEIFKLENTIFNVLLLTDKKSAKFALLKNMDIDINERELVKNPIDQSKIALTQLFSVTYGENILITLKFLGGLSKDTKYKEIYYIFIIFDVLDFSLTFPNSVQKEMKKYANEYPYSKDVVDNRKYAVLDSDKPKNYLYAFSVEDGDEKEDVEQALKELKIDFETKGNAILLNSFYFKNMNRVLNDMETNQHNQNIN